MKIAFVCDYILSGKNRAHFQRTNMLADNSNFYIFTMRDNLPFEVKMKAKGIYIFPFNVPSVLNRYFFILWALFKIVIVNKSVQFDMVYTTYKNHHLLVGYLLQRLIGVIWIADIWDVLELEYIMFLKRRNFSGKINSFLSKPLLKYAIKSLKKADLVIIALLPKYLKGMRIDSKKILHVTNGVDLSLTYAKKTLGKCKRQRLNLTYVGHIWKSRGVGTLIECAKILSKWIKDFDLNLIGYMREEDKRWVQNEITENDLAGQINLLGEKTHEDVLSFIDNADICIYPFDHFPELEYIYPIKIFEYMAMGKLVIASNLEGVSTIIRHGENGLIFRAGDSFDLAKKILFAVNNKNRISVIKQNAMQTVKRYDWSEINRRILQRLTLINQIKSDIKRWVKEIHEEEDAWRIDEEHFIYQSERDILLSMINQPSDKILEIGVGRGRYTQYLAKCCRNLISLDLSYEMVSSARKRMEKQKITNVSFIVADAEMLPFKKNLFSNIAAAQVIGNLPNPEKMINESMNVLINRGKLIFSTGNLLYLKNFLIEVKLRIKLRLKLLHRVSGTSDRKNIIYLQGHYRDTYFSIKQLLTNCNINEFTFTATGFFTSKLFKSLNYVSKYPPFEYFSRLMIFSIKK